MFVIPVARIAASALAAADWTFDALQRRRERRQLAGLDDRALLDIGISRADVDAEVSKPWWRA